MTNWWPSIDELCNADVGAVHPGLIVIGFSVAFLLIASMAIFDAD